MRSKELRSKEIGTMTVDDDYDGTEEMRSKELRSKEMGTMTVDYDDDNSFGKCR